MAGRAEDAVADLGGRRHGVIRTDLAHADRVSDLETTFFELIARSPLPDPEKQVPISGPDGFIGIVDFLWPDARVVVEIDSSWHDGPLDAAHDTERDERLHAAGYRVLRYRFGDIVLEPTRVLRELGAAIRSSAG